MVAGTVASAVEVARESATQAQERFVALGPEVWVWAHEDAQTAVSGVVRSFQELLALHSLPQLNVTPALRGYWTDLWVAGHFIPVAKWATAAPMAALAGVRSDGRVLFREIPPMPTFLPSGCSALRALFPRQVEEERVYCALRTRLHESGVDGKPRARALKLAWSLLGLKSSMPSMRVDGVLDNLKDHSVLLASEPPTLPQRSRDILRLVGLGIARLTAQRYETEGLRPRPGEPRVLCPDRQPIVRYDDLPAAKLSASSGFVKYYDETEQKWTKMSGTRAAQFHALGGFHTEELMHMMYTPKMGTKEIRAHPYQFHWKDWDYSPHVAVVALQEPFKIRTISIADGPSTAAGSRLQRAWHTTMRQLRPFQLIGGTPVEEALQSVKWNPELPFVSGDYSAATDRLSASASRQVFDALLQGVAIDPELRDRLARGLFSAEVDYSRTLDQLLKGLPDQLADYLKASVPATFTQRNGQLMGNILSFPILCQVNLAAWIEARYRYSITAYESPTAQTTAVVDSTACTSEEECPDWMRHLDFIARFEAAQNRGYFTESDFSSFEVLVNGDDILFQAQPEEYEIWRSIIGSYGLKLSVGKNYYSKEFLTINSELWKWVDGDALRRVERPWWGGLQPDFLRARNDLKRKFGDDILTADFRVVLQKVQQRFLESLPQDHRDEGNQLWFKRMKAARPFEPYRGLNWFLPQEQMGFGLDSRGIEPGEVTYAQKKLAVRAALWRGTQGGPESLAPKGSLVSEKNTRLVRSSVETIKVTGEVIEVRGRQYVLDKKPLVFRWVGDKAVLRYAAHETLDSYVQRSGHVTHWLDYHVEGIRLVEEELKRKITRLLKWGMAVSDKYVDAYYPTLDGRPVHRVLQELAYLDPSDLESAKALTGRKAGFLRPSKPAPSQGW
jgi:hypothetical protein